MCAKKCDKMVKCKEYTKKIIEETCKKLAEAIVVGLVLGASFKVMLALPAVIGGVTVARMITIKLL